VSSTTCILLVQNPSTCTHFCLSINENNAMYKRTERSNSTTVIRSLKSIFSLGNLRTIYFSTVHSIISYGIIFWGNSTYSNIIFKIQKRVIRIMMNVRNKEFCRELFKNLNILPLHSQYILSLLLFVVKNLNMFIIQFGGTH